MKLTMLSPRPKNSIEISRTEHIIKFQSKNTDKSNLHHTLENVKNKRTIKLMSRFERKQFPRILLNRLKESVAMDKTRD